jgi:hypothetical protein
MEAERKSLQGSDDRREGRRERYGNVPRLEKYEL